VHELILWAGFFGAWLLVAGPLHQARVELAEEEFERETFEPLVDQLGSRPHVSAWWWLLPPLRLYVGHRVRDQWQRKVWLSLPDEQFEALSSFMAKARGWMLVGTGGLLIATKETYELVEGHEWPVWLVWVIVLGMTLLCVASTALQAAREAGVASARTAQDDGPQ